MEEFLNFVRENIVGIILIGVGLLCYVGNIYVFVSNRKRKAHVSGIPLLGAILVLAGGLLTSYKWLALLALLDPSLIGLFQSIHYGRNLDKMLEKRYADFLSKHGFTLRLEDPQKQITSEIHYENREIPHIQTRPYITNQPFMFGYPWAVMLIGEKDGKRFLILDTGTDGNIKKLEPEKVRILDFSEDSIRLHDIADYLLGDVEIRIEKKTPEE